MIDNSKQWQKILADRKSLLLLLKKKRNINNWQGKIINSSKPQKFRSFSISSVILKLK